MNRRTIAQSVIFAFTAIGYFPFSEWLSTAKIGTDLFLWGQLAYFLFLVFGIVVLPVLIVSLFFRRARPSALAYLFLLAIFIPCCMAGIILGHKVRTAGMRAFAQRSRPLVAAINAYSQQHSTPPDSLEDLVPNFLPEIPSTGMMAYPKFEYQVGPDAQARYADNQWVLRVFTPSGGINFDEILYFPNQQYPKVGYGGGLERIEDWAYVHE